MEYKFPPEGREVSVRGKEVYVRGMALLQLVADELDRVGIGGTGYRI